jgi:hypothetical protein
MSSRTEFDSESLSSPVRMRGMTVSGSVSGPAKRVRNWLSLAIGLLLVCVVACDGTAQRTLFDSEGRQFAARCGKEGPCRVLRSSSLEGHSSVADKANDDNPETYRLRALGRVVSVCGPLRGGSEPSSADCRPLVCKSDTDCPNASGLSRGVCINQLCTEPSHAVQVEDAILMCLSGTGVGPLAGIRAERHALGVNCGNPCKIPRPCRQL